MLSAKKILYLIMLSLIISCAAMGIDYRVVAVEENIEDVVIVSYKPSSGFYSSGTNTSLSADITPDEGTASNTSPSSDQTDPTETDPSMTDPSETDPSETDPTETGTTDNLITLTPVGPTTTTRRTETTTTTTRPTTTTTTRRTTTTTRRTTTTTRTTTTRRPTTTTTEKTYKNTGKVKFSPSQVRIYSSNKTSLSVDFSSAIGAYQITAVSSMNSAVASARRVNASTVEVTGLSVGVSWIQGIADNGDIFYCRVEVTDFVGEVIRLTNEQRALYGLPALKRGDSLVQTASDIRLGEIKSVFAHSRPNGREFSTVAGEIGLRYTHIGENLAMGQKTPQAVVTAWMNSTSHRNNILSRNSRGQSIPYEYIVVSYGRDSKGVAYWVQMFYTP
ncbi:MAG: hypothetical protein J6L81_06015 [Clostridia bacterium]|nr:hypothetical protein [Clostridia bacterium]